MARCGAMTPPWWPLTLSASSRSGPSSAATGCGLPGIEEPQRPTRSRVERVVVPLGTFHHAEAPGEPGVQRRAGFLAAEPLERHRGAGELIALGAGAAAECEHEAPGAAQGQRPAHPLAAHRARVTPVEPPPQLEPRVGPRV